MGKNTIKKYNLLVSGGKKVLNCFVLPIDKLIFTNTYIVRLGFIPEIAEVRERRSDTRLTKV